MSSFVSSHGLRSRPRSESQSSWLVSKRYDLTFLIGNGLIVPGALAALAMGLSGDLFDVGVTALVGAPHLFATFSTAASNRSFRARHPLAVPTAAFIPLGVVWLSLYHYQLLISLFLGAASF